jgi:hypothetical protein
MHEKNPKKQEQTQKLTMSSFRTLNLVLASLNSFMTEAGSKVEVSIASFSCTFRKKF